MPPDPTPTGSTSLTLEALLAILDLEPVEDNLFRGLSPQTPWQRVFGGQVIGQALMAATRTVDDALAHSLHAYFLRPGDPRVPIFYEVDRIRDGRSFATRRVVARQRERAIFSMSASFHRPEAGLAHQIAMPSCPSPDAPPSQAPTLSGEDVPEVLRAYQKEARPFEIRPLDLSRFTDMRPAEPRQRTWIRTMGRLPTDPRLHQCVLAYASDLLLLDTGLIAHGRQVFDPALFMASLDHAMWFHDDFRADDWLLYAMDSPVGKHARHFNRGQIFAQDGRLVASTAQEGLIRQRR